LAIAWTTAAGLHFLPFGVAIAIAASAGFATPLGYQTHLMVYGAGGYRFSDFVRLGAPLDILAMALTVAIAPIAFPFLLGGFVFSDTLITAHGGLLVAFLVVRWC